MTKIKLSSFSPPASEIAPSDSGSSVSPVTHEDPDFAASRFGQVAVLEIFQEANLIDRQQRGEAHRHGWKLPEFRHQPGMRIARQGFAGGLLAKAEKLVLAEPALEKRARVDAGRTVALEQDQLAAMVLRRRMPEMAEADIIGRCGRLEARNVTAELGALLVGAQHDRERVPADDRAQLVFDGAVARLGRLLAQRNRVAIGRPRLFNCEPAFAGGVDYRVDDELGPLIAAMPLDG
ncbi:hypothetical protein ACVIIV_003083 [Bradyrhizobium sp. USDA 4354]